MGRILASEFPDRNIDLIVDAFDIGRHYLCRDRWFKPIM